MSAELNVTSDRLRRTLAEETVAIICAYFNHEVVNVYAAVSAANNGQLVLTPPQRALLLSALPVLISRAKLVQNEGDEPVRITAAPALENVGGSCDVSKLPSLTVTAAYLRRLLSNLPRWPEAAERPLSPPRQGCHSKCKRVESPGLREAASPQEAKLRLPPRRTPVGAAPLYLLDRPHLPTEEWFRTVRLYNKHFRDGSWMREYERLAGDLRECSFQPNMARLAAGAAQLRRPLRAPADPFAAGDPFAAVREESTAKLRAEIEAMRASPEAAAAQSSPRYKTRFTSRHRGCAAAAAARARQARPERCRFAAAARAPAGAGSRRWELSLRADGGAAPPRAPADAHQRCITHRPFFDNKKERRYAADNYHKYIRLSGRAEIPVILPGVLNLHKCGAVGCGRPACDLAPVLRGVRETAAGAAEAGRSAGAPAADRLVTLPRHAECHRSAVFTCRAREDAYRRAERLGLRSATQLGLERGELRPPPTVVGLRVDPTLFFEKRLLQQTPVPLTRLVGLSGDLLASCVVPAA